MFDSVLNADITQLRNLLDSYGFNNYWLPNDHQVRVAIGECIISGEIEESEVMDCHDKGTK